MRAASSSPWPHGRSVRTARRHVLHGRLCFGVTADRDSTPDVAVLDEGIVARVRERYRAAVRIAG